MRGGGLYLGLLPGVCVGRGAGVGGSPGRGGGGGGGREGEGLGGGLRLLGHSVGAAGEVKPLEAAEVLDAEALLLGPRLPHRTHADVRTALEGLEAAWLGGAAHHPGLGEGLGRGGEGLELGLGRGSELGLGRGLELCLEGGGGAGRGQLDPALAALLPKRHKSGLLLLSCCLWCKLLLRPWLLLQ